MWSSIYQRRDQGQNVVICWGSFHPYLTQLSDKCNFCLYALLRCILAFCRLGQTKTKIVWHFRPTATSPLHNLTLSSVSFRAPSSTHCPSSASGTFKSFSTTVLLGPCDPHSSSRCCASWRVCQRRGLAFFRVLSFAVYLLFVRFFASQPWLVGCRPCKAVLVRGPPSANCLLVCLSSTGCI